MNTGMQTPVDGIQYDNPSRPLLSSLVTYSPVLTGQAQPTNVRISGWDKEATTLMGGGNAALLEEFLRIRGEEFLKSQMAPGESSDDLRGVEGKKKNGKRMPKKDLAVVKPGAGMDSDEEAETVKK